MDTIRVVRIAEKITYRNTSNDAHKTTVLLLQLGQRAVGVYGLCKGLGPVIADAVLLQAMDGKREPNRPNND